MGTIFPPENKDISIFPEKINGKYCALHRPNNSLAKPAIWYADSSDLIGWGNHKCIARSRDNQWEEYKIGGGAPCIKTKEGWLQIYHAKGNKQIYSMMCLLLDLERPYIVLKRSDEPFLKPEMPYEIHGFCDNVVFANGFIMKDDKLFIYYGAADESTCLCYATVDELLSTLK